MTNSNDNNESRKYAFLMVYYDTPDIIKDIQKKIKPSELYEEDDNDWYGLENETHVTLVPCLEMTQISKN